MAAPIGNTNSSRDNRLWANTIRRAVAQGDADRLRKIAEKLLDKAAEGDMQAIKELGDRLDGRAHQTLDANVSGSLTTVLAGLGRPQGSAGDDPPVAG